MRRDVKWLCEHAQALEKYSGRGVVCHPQEGRVRPVSSLSKIDPNSFFFHVPSKKELAAPLIVARKK